MRHRALVVSGLVALAGCPSKKDREREMEATYRKFVDFKDLMCACKDKACADRVQERMTTWSQEMVKTAIDKPYKADEALMKKFADAGTQYAACMAKLVSIDPVRADVPPPSAKQDVDTLVRAGRDWVRTNHAPLVLERASISYVDQTGALDEEHGKLYVLFGRTQLSGDDPKRRTGAPVKEPMKFDDCIALTWQRQQGWVNLGAECTQVMAPAVRCSIAEIWKRALAHQAPADALATIELRSEWDQRSWHFRIEDEPRNVHVAHVFPDDCPLVVEK